MIVLGRVVAPYGVQGWVKLHPFGDDPAAWRGVKRWWLGRDPEGSQWQPLALQALRAHGKGLIAKFVGVEDRTAAEALDGGFLGVERADLPQTESDEYYWGDLIGLVVTNAEGDCLGKVAELIETGANTVLVVRDGELERLLPFVGAVIKEVDVANGRIDVEWQKDW